MSSYDHIRPRLIAAAITLGCVVAPGALVAQSAPTQQSSSEVYDDYFMSPEHRRAIYEESRKKPQKAVLYSLLLPGVGNVYAEQYLLAGLSFVLVVFAGTFIGYGIANDQPRIIAIGGVTAALAYGGGVATSLLGVSDHNRKLRQGLKVEGADVREMWTPTLVVWRF